MSSTRICFIGGGNMARSLIAGLISRGHDPQCITVGEPDADARARLHETHGVGVGEDNAAMASEAEVVVLAVKPQVMKPVVEALAPTVRESRPLSLSIAAGVGTGLISRWLGFDAPVVRTMPNTPALLGCGATALFANSQTGPEQRALAEAILSAVGITKWVARESALDAVTAVSGSGPAYYFLLMECMERAGIELGLDGKTARELTLQTALGAARMALESGEAPATLRERVTSPGGTTEQAVLTYREGGFEALVERALRAAHDRSVSLGAEFGKESG